MFDPFIDIEIISFIKLHVTGHLSTCYDRNLLLFRVKKIKSKWQSKDNKYF